MTAETVNMGKEAGSVAPGDLVIVGGHYDTVTRVAIHPPESHPGSPIRHDWHAVEAITARGSRWAGAPVAAIESDLRAHWNRTTTKENTP